MQEDEARLKFLKKIVGNQTVDMVDLFKDLLPEKMKGYRGYSVIIHRDRIAGGDTPAGGLMQFSKTAYDIWYDYIMGLDEKRVVDDEVRAALHEIKQSAELQKQRMTPERCYEFIFELFPKKYSKKMCETLMPAWAQSGNEPIYKGQVGYDFIHFCPQIAGKHAECRLYLNLKPENSWQVADILVKRCKAEGFSLYGKFWTLGSDRSDSFLVYTSFKNVERMVEILEDIRKENPELFEGAEKMNPFVCKVNSFIGYGDEPQYMHSSFNEERAKAADEFFGDLIAKEYKAIGNFFGKVTTSKGEVLGLREYLIYRIRSEFVSKVSQCYNGAVNGNVSEEFADPTRRKSLVEFYDKLRKACRTGLPEQITKQFEILADKAIESLKLGKRPMIGDVKIKSSRSEIFHDWAQNNVKSSIKQNGYAEYPIGLSDYDLSEKLFKVFGSEERLKKQITRENIKPYCDKHHISIDHPCLNLESDRCL